MFGIGYCKGNPTDYILQFANGKIVREGAGLSFFYFAPTSTIVSVPQASVNVPFVFHEPTTDFQTITVQGQLTYRIADAKRISAMLDFQVDSRGRYTSDHYQKLPERLIYALQTVIRDEMQGLGLRTALQSGDTLGPRVMSRVKTSPEVVQLGIEILNIAILSLKPTPDMAKALEAETRESLNRNSDEAVYKRRYAAIEQERSLKENELQTELLVQTKRRELKERELEGDIALERQRSSLTDEKVGNERKEADSRAYALKAVIAPVEGLDWRVLMMLNQNGGDARSTIAMAFQELATNAQKIGELNVSPDLLRTLIGSDRRV